MVLDPVDAQDADLVKRPPGDGLRKVPIQCFYRVFLPSLLHRRIEPLVAQHIGRSHNGESRRVARLEGAHKGELGPAGEEVVEGFGFIFGAVTVRCGGSAQDRGKEGTVAKGMADAVGECEGPCSSCLSTSCSSIWCIRRRKAKKILVIRPEGSGRRQQQHIMFLGGRNGIVVEVVDDETVAIGGQVDIELQKERDEAGGDGRRAGEGQEYVALGVDKLEEDVGCQVGTKTCVQG